MSATIVSASGAPVPARGLRTHLGEHGPTFAIALALAAALSWLGLTGFAFTDYDEEAAPAFLALLHGDVGRFLELAPAYAGSLVLRAPFAVLPTLWGGGELAAFRAGALPGLLACALLATAVVGRMRAAGRPRLDRAVVLVALAASPVAMLALETGHPEELLGAALCVTAVLLAARRPLLAALLVGVAVANKPWALVAVPVVLATVPAGSRIRAAVISGAATLTVVSPLLLAGAGRFASATATARQTGEIFQPWQVWYLLGDEGSAVRSVNAGERELRHAPEWVAQANRPLILLLAAGIAALWWWRRRGRGDTADPLLLLALVLHVRCLIDPWNFDYYALPAVMALAAWEGLARPRCAPVLSLAYVVGVWQSFEVAKNRLEPDLLSAVYLGWAVPLALLLAALLFIRPAGAPGVKARGSRADPLSARPTC